MSVAFLASLALAQATSAAPVIVQDAKIMTGWVADTDYPAAALRQRRGGHTIVRFLVTVRGRVAECAVGESSGHADLDARGCVIAKRFRFRPARVAGGGAVAQRFALPIWWTPRPHIRLEGPVPEGAPATSRPRHSVGRTTN